MSKYVEIDELLENKGRYKLIWGGRGNGKSYAVKDYCLKKAVLEGKEFVYLRRYAEDIKPAKIRAYFEDYDIQSLTDYKADYITCHSGNIYLCKVTDDFKEKRIKKIGSVLFLGGSEHYKSMQFPFVENIIFEEFLTKKRYSDMEVSDFQSIISTVFRNRDGRVWMIGNPESKFNPILNDWGITKKLVKQKKGTINTYDIGEGQKLVSYRTIEQIENKFVFSKKEHIVSGEWDVDSVPLMCYNKGEYENILKIKYSSLFSFNIYLCVFNDTGKQFLFVYPRTVDSDYDFEVNTRVNAFAEKYVLKNLTSSILGKNLLTHIANGDVVYSSNECGTDFMQCLSIDKII